MRLFWPLRFVCQMCELLSVHEAKDFDQEEPALPDLFDSDRDLRYVQIECTQRQCGRRYTIYTQVPPSAERDDVLYILQHAKRPITCGETDHHFDTKMVLRCGRVNQG